LRQKANSAVSNSVQVQKVKGIDDTVLRNGEMLHLEDVGQHRATLP